MRDKQTKAFETLKDEKVIYIGETFNYMYFKVVGKEVYDVIFNKQKQRFSCTCPNIRFVDCYHIVAVKEYLRLIGVEYEETQKH